MPNVDIEKLLTQAFSYITKYFNSLEPLYILGGSSLLAFFLLFVILLQKKHAQLTRQSLNVIESLTDTVQLSKGLESNLNDVLGFFCKYIDEKKDSYVLKSVRHKAVNEGQIAPSYSGLLPFKKELYLPPVSVKPSPVPKDVKLVKDGEVPLLIIPVKGGKGLVYIGPVSKIPRKAKPMLTAIAEKLQPFLDMLMETEILKSQVEIVVASSKAIHNISSIVMNDESMLSAIMGVSMKTIGASGGFFIRKYDDIYSMDASMGLDKEMESLFNNDRNTHLEIYDMISNNSILILKKDDRNYFRLPSYFSAAGIEMLILVNINTELVDGLAGFVYETQTEIEEFRLSALLMLTKRVGDIINYRQRVKELSSSYVDTLKTLAHIMDNLNPYNIGYSELMYRYSVITAKELKLEPRQVKDIGLAAYLSNLGVMGLSTELLQKEGKYTELEYELMKLHADVGASIIEATIGNSSVASCIRHHHERIDGYGYPSGLKGNEIPIGARIIAVVQTFLAKITGRPGRDPMPFEKALDLLKSAAGTQLDTTVIQAFTDWFRKKQGAPLSSGRSLGYCWEMRCSPENICSACPVYKNIDKNCWEYENNNCRLHGNNCETCFIHTEFISRYSRGRFREQKT